MRRTSLVLAGAALAVTLLIVVLLPPAASVAPPPPWTPAWHEVRGAYHVHSVRSDGSGTVEEIAAAAARAGLDFVIVTDHGNAMRPPDAPAYRHGVLCLDGVEISTSDGHYVALGLAGAAPYPLAGPATAVIEDVWRLGGFGVVAHPGSPKPGLRWQAWDAPFDGLEWLNADSEWRDELWSSLGRLLLTYAFRPRETLARIIDRPHEVLAEWDRLALERRVPALAGADAHARLGWRQSVDPYEDRVLLRAPSYEQSFRVFSNRVVLAEPFTGDADGDAAALLDAIANGRVYSVIDGLAGAGRVEFEAASGGQIARPGEYLDADGRVTLSARLAAPEGTALVVLRDGVSIHETRQPVVRLELDDRPAAYRLEARLPWSRGDREVPWILTNPIYAGLREIHAGRAELSAAAGRARQLHPIATEHRTFEASAGSASTIAIEQLADGTPVLAWHFELGSGTTPDEYAALRFPVLGLNSSDRVRLRARADRPMRVWLQVRADGEDSDARWGTSFYLDREVRGHDLGFDSFRSLGAFAGDESAVPFDRVDSLLLVVSPVNTLPGTKGRVQFLDLWLAK